MEPGAASEGGAQQVPRARNPAAEPDSSPSKQSELKLNVGIGIIGTLLSVFVTILFLTVEEEPILAIVFGLIAIISAAITIYVYGRRRRALRS